MWAIIKNKNSMILMYYNSSKYIYFQLIMLKLEKNCGKLHRKLKIQILQKDIQSRNSNQNELNIEVASIEIN